MARKLRREFIELLEKDIEFRYTVAGYLGLSEILKRMDRLEERMVKLEEGQEKLWEEVRDLREGQNKLWQEVRDLREDQNKLWESNNKLWEEVRDMRLTLNRVAVTLDRLTISVEEEALSVVKHRLRQEIGVEVELSRIFIDSGEVNIYGAVGDLCVVGEASVRLGKTLVDELLRKIQLIRKQKPELIKPRIIKVIYTDYATPDSIEHARENNVWILKWDKDLTPLKITTA